VPVGCHVDGQAHRVDGFAYGLGGHAEHNRALARSHGRPVFDWHVDETEQQTRVYRVGTHGVGAFDFPGGSGDS
jgi:hypothetical protein